VRHRQVYLEVNKQHIVGIDITMHDPKFPNETPYDTLTERKKQQLYAEQKLHSSHGYCISLIVSAADALKFAISKSFTNCFIYFLHTHSFLHFENVSAAMSS